MKKILIAVLCIALLASLCGCGNGGSSDRSGSQTASVNDVLAAGTNQAVNTEDPENTVNTVNTVNTDNTAQAQPSENTVPVSAEKEYDKIDVDLTVLSSTMVYSEVYNITTNPQAYVGKVIKMDGAFDMYHDTQSGNYYFACIIKDATACCAQGIEFVLTDDYHYPYDYPKVGEDVCVVGEFDIYEENGSVFCTLRNAKLL